MEVPNGGTIEPETAFRYGLEFKLKAVRLTRIAGRQVQAVAESQDLHLVTLLSQRGKTPSSK